MIFVHKYTNSGRQDWALSTDPEDAKKFPSDVDAAMDTSLEAESASEVNGEVPLPDFIAEDEGRFLRVDQVRALGRQYRADHPELDESAEAAEVLAPIELGPQTEDAAPVRFSELKVGEMFTHPRHPEAQFRKKTEGGYLRPGVRLRDENGKIVSIGNAFNHTDKTSHWFGPDEEVTRDDWSDEARAAALEARRAHAKHNPESESLRTYPSREEWPEHVKALKIPPAWKDVRVSADPEAALQAIGKDEKGRAQYVYSPQFAGSQAALKFARIASMQKVMPLIDSQLQKMRASDDEKQIAHGDVLTLIREMGLRPGSEEETGAKVKAYGASTLEGRHVVLDGNEVRLRFVGKKGVHVDLPVENPEIATMLRARAERAGADGKLFPGVTAASLLHAAHSLDHGGYVPHVTIAYLTPKAAENHSGAVGLKGQTIRIDRAAICDPEDNWTEVPLATPTGDAWSKEARVAAAEARKLSAEEKAAARTRLAAIPPLGGDFLRRWGSDQEGKHVGTEEVFGKPHVNLLWDVKPTQERTYGTVKEFPISELTPAQEHIPIEGLRKYIEDLPTTESDSRGDGREREYLPHVLTYQGRNFITAGHTRLGAQALAGRSHAVVRHYEMDRNQNLIRPK